jgi:hypothetical protein
LDEFVDGCNFLKIRVYLRPSMVPTLVLGLLPRVTPVGLFLFGSQRIPASKRHQESMCERITYPQQRAACSRRQKNPSIEKYYLDEPLTRGTLDHADWKRESINLHENHTPFDPPPA